MRRIVCRFCSRFIALACSLVCVLWLVACSDLALQSPEMPLSGKISIAHLKTLARGISTTIVQDVTIEGYVVANDLYGEYYKSIVICDESGGIEISVDSDDTAYKFPVSSCVTVSCNSLALGDYGGTLILGAQPTGECIVDRVAERDFERYFSVDKSNLRQVEPVKITISELAAQYINNFVFVEDVTFGEQAGLTWCEKDAETGEFITTERLLWERSGACVKVRILHSCDYASGRVPSGYGAVAAMVEYFGDEYVLKIINRNIVFDKSFLVNAVK